MSKHIEPSPMNPSNDEQQFNDVDQATEVERRTKEFLDSLEFEQLQLFPTD